MDTDKFYVGHVLSLLEVEEVKLPIIYPDRFFSHFRPAGGLAGQELELDDVLEATTVLAVHTQMALTSLFEEKKIKWTGYEATKCFCDFALGFEKKHHGTQERRRYIKI